MYESSDNIPTPTKGNRTCNYDHIGKLKVGESVGYPKCFYSTLTNNLKYRAEHGSRKYVGRIYLGEDGKKEARIWRTA